MRLTLARKQQAPRHAGAVAAATALAVAGALAGCGAPGTARLTVAAISRDSAAMRPEHLTDPFRGPVSAAGKRDSPTPPGGTRHGAGPQAR